MCRRLHRACTALYAALASAACAPDASEGAPRGLVVVVVDTLRADHALGSDRAATPRMDEIAAEGVSFPRAYAHVSWTLPSHVALFSSRPPQETGVLLNGQEVPGDLPLLAEHLRRLGWRTRAVVSLASLTPVVPERGIDRGFEVFDDLLQPMYSSGDDVVARLEPVLDELAAGDDPFLLFAHFCDPHEPYEAHGTAVHPARLLLNGEPVAEVQNLAEFQTLVADVVLERGENVLAIDAEVDYTANLFVVTGPDGEELPVDAGAIQEGILAGAVRNDDEGPVEARVEVWASDVPPIDEVRRRYALEVEWVDRWVGALADGLRSRGLWNSSLVILTADHGEGLEDHGLRSHGLNLHDELLRVPLAVKPPAEHPAWDALRARRDVLARHVDVVPTALDVLDLPALPGQRGTSLLRDAERLHEAVMHWPVAEDQVALTDGRHKLVWAPGPDLHVLYDLASDPAEIQDVAADRPDLVETWMPRLERIASDLVRRIPEVPEPDPDLGARLRALGY